MYPQYWTTSIGGIVIKYSNEYKTMCIDLYRQGKWPETPEGIKEKEFRRRIRDWVRTKEAYGPEGVKCKQQYKQWTAEEKYKLVARVLAEESSRSVAAGAGIDSSMLRRCVREYKIKGYKGLAALPKGRHPREPQMKKKAEPTELTPSEREELVRLRAENEYLRTEIEARKKEMALRYERWDEQLKAKKQRSSRNSAKKDTN